MKILIDGPDQILYQWDKGQRLMLHGADSGTRVDFARCDQNKAVSQYAYSEDGAVFCDIPDALLAEPDHLHGYVYEIDGDRGETVREFMIPVIRRPMPEDYVAPDEVPTWHELDQRIKKIEDEGVPDEKIERAVEDYLEENPIEAPKPDLTGVVKSVNGKTPDENGNVEITIPDSPQHGGFVAQPEPPDDKSLLWIDTDDETSDEPETEPGGYYTPTVSQPDANTMEVSFAASAEGMPDVEAVRVTLPAGPRGEQGPEGPQGEQGETGARGPAGETGPAGKTPVRGVDYWTDADKQEIAEMAAELVEVPEGGGGSGGSGGGASEMTEIFRLTTTEEVGKIETGIDLNQYSEIVAFCDTIPVDGTSANTHFDWYVSRTAGLRINSSLHSTQRRMHMAHITRLGENRMHTIIGYGLGGDPFATGIHCMSSDNVLSFSNLNGGYIVDNVNTNFAFGSYKAATMLKIGTRVIVYGRKL